MTGRLSKGENASGLRALIDGLYAMIARQDRTEQATLYSVVLRPGDTSGAPNVFTSWATLYAKCSGIAGGVRVYLDDNLGSISVPAGSYAIDGWRFETAASFANLNGGALVTLQDGCKFVANAEGNLTFALGSWVYFQSQSTTTAVVTTAAGEVNVRLEAFSAINSLGAAGFFHNTGAVADAFLWLHMTNASIGDSAHPTIVFDAGAGGQINMISSEIHTQALSGAGIAGLEVFVSYDSNVEQPNTAANLQWGLANEDMTTTGDVKPTTVTAAGAGSTATASTSNGSNATAGTLNLTPGGAGIAAGDQVTVTFNRAYNQAPRAVLLLPANAATANAIGDAWYVHNVTANGWTMAVTTALAGGTAYQWFYVVLG